MYKELRSYGSTGQAWAVPFLAADIRLLDRLKCASLRFDPRWQAIRARLRPGATLLDAGCGMGLWPVFLRGRGYSTIGVDFSTELIDTLRERYPAMDWRAGQVQELPVRTGSVDAVISWGVIEHDETGPAKALREFSRVLRPGGLAFITVPIDSEAQRRCSQAQFAGADSQVFFQYFLTADELVQELKGAGLEVLEGVRPVSRHHALAYPALYVRLATLPPLLQRAAGWLLKPTLPLLPSSINMLLAVARRA
jgi:ubiquinone/menaquinone biosynthesis C-methylase UbiE